MHEGHVLNHSLHTHLIPTTLDAPAAETHTVLSSDGKGPSTVKGIGEPAIIPAAPAVANATQEATRSGPLPCQLVAARPAKDVVEAD